MTDDQAALLQFTVPCGYSGTIEGYELTCIQGMVSMDGQVNFPCEDCNGSGVRYPFRLPCPCIRYLEQRESDWLRCLPCGSCGYEHNGHAGDEAYGPCIHCDGLGYIFNADPDVLWDAVRARGWYYMIECFDEGDVARVYGLDPTTRDIQHPTHFGYVFAGEGLRGQAAMEHALVLAMEAVGKNKSEVSYGQ